MHGSVLHIMLWILIVGTAVALLNSIYLSVGGTGNRGIDAIGLFNVGVLWAIVFGGWGETLLMLGLGEDVHGGSSVAATIGGGLLIVLGIIVLIATLLFSGSM